MKDGLFQELLQNAKQAAAHSRGEKIEDARVITVDVKDAKTVLRLAT